MRRVVLGVLGPVRVRGPVRVVVAVCGARVFAVEGDAGLGGVVQAGRFLAHVVAHPHRHHAVPVRDGHVQAVPRQFRQQFLLQRENILQRRDQRRLHLRRRVALFPRAGAVSAAGLLGVLRQVGHVERGEVLAVGPSPHGRVGVVVHLFRHAARDLLEGGDAAVMHDDVPAEGERVVVDRHHGRRCRGADVREQAPARGVLGDGSEIQIVQRRLRAFVQGRTGTFQGGVGRAGGGVPCYADAVDIEVAIPGRELQLALDGVRVVGLETREEVGVDLLAQGVVGGDQDIFQETLLGGGDVREPATHA